MEQDKKVIARLVPVSKNNKTILITNYPANFYINQDQLEYLENNNNNQSNPNPNPNNKDKDEQLNDEQYQEQQQLQNEEQQQNIVISITQDKNIDKTYIELKMKNIELSIFSKKLNLNQQYDIENGEILDIQFNNNQDISNPINSKSHQIKYIFQKLKTQIRQYNTNSNSNLINNNHLNILKAQTVQANSNQSNNILQKQDNLIIQQKQLEQQQQQQDNEEEEESKEIQEDQQKQQQLQLQNCQEEEQQKQKIQQDYKKQNKEIKQDKIQQDKQQQKEQKIQFKDINYDNIKRKQKQQQQQKKNIDIELENSFLKERINFIKKLDENYENDLSCAICLEVMYNPYTIIGCLHSFCGDCLSKTIYPNNNQLQPICPYCRENITDIKLNPLLNSSIDKYLRQYPQYKKNSIYYRIKDNENKCIQIQKIFESQKQLINHIDLQNVAQDSNMVLIYTLAILMLLDYLILIFFRKIHDTFIGQKI